MYLKSIEVQDLNHLPIKLNSNSIMESPALSVRTEVEKVT